VRFPVVMLLSALASQAYAIEPGTPGFVDYSKTSFAVGDTVWVFKTDSDPTMDRNGYIVPYEWHEVLPSEGVISEACHRLRGPSTYRVQMFWGAVELECHIAIPQQRAVVIKP